MYLNPNGNLITVGGNGVGYASTFSVRQSGSNACFSVEDSTASYSYLYVNSSGKVGIGTSSPTNWTLDVFSTGANSIQLSSNSNTRNSNNSINVNSNTNGLTSSNNIYLAANPKAAKLLADYKQIILELSKSFSVFYFLKL